MHVALTMDAKQFIMYKKIQKQGFFFSYKTDIFSCKYHPLAPNLTLEEKK